MNCTAQLQRFARVVASRRKYHGLRFISWKWTGRVFWIQRQSLLYLIIYRQCNRAQTDAKQDANRIQQIFSAEKKPTLWRVLPAIERLQTAWEAKRDEKKYAIYREALNDGLDKLRKYYTRFDEKPVYILALGTSYIDMI
jgi:hypothetical protein